MAAQSHGKPLKKKFGQHFLRNQSIADVIVDCVELNDASSVFEIGGGDGFLTKTILQRSIARLWVFEIDPHWVEVLQEIDDERLKVYEKNFLDLDFSLLTPFKPWTLLANLPYQVTFPILHKLQKNRALLKEGVIMIQEEVAQKILKTSGRGYGYPSLFFQHYFDWEKMQKISPGSFYPPPKVFSRLLYFKPKKVVQEIPDEEGFWKFIKLCFSQPRRTLRNNLKQTHYDMDSVPAKYLDLRAQQMSMADFMELWDIFRC